jgi:hypothetical protein
MSTFSAFPEIAVPAKPMTKKTQKIESIIFILLSFFFG